MKVKLQRSFLVIMLVFCCFLIAGCNFYTPNYTGPNNNTDVNQDDEDEDEDEDEDGEENPDDGEKPNDGTQTVEIKEKIINVYLIGGQSNAVGYGQDTGNKLANADPRFRNGFNNVLYFGRQQHNSGEVLSNKFQPVKIGCGNESNTCGAEIGIASALANNGEMNAIIKCAWGATHLYPDTNYYISEEVGTWTSPSYIKKNNVDLSKNEMIGAMYTWFEETVTEGLELLIADGYTPVIKGMWWMQGEAEMGSNTMQKAYTELLTTLISDVRNTVSDITGADYSEMPFVFGLPSWNPTHSGAPAYQEQVRQQMSAVANDPKVVNAACVDCKGLVQHDMWHFDAAGQKYLGEQFVAAVKKLNEGNNAKFNESIIMSNEIDILTDTDALQFNATIAKYNPANNYEYGMLIVPTTALTTNKITGNYISELDKARVPYENVECEVNINKLDSTYSRATISGDISNISYNYLNTNYTAIAYIKNSNGTYKYTSSSVNSTLAKVASKLMCENTTSTSAISKYAYGGINQLDGIKESNGYDKPTFSITTQTKLNLSIGHSGQIKVVQNPDVDYYVKYTSANPSIITVDKDGNVHALGVGSTTIAVECCGVKEDIEVNVVKETYNGVVYDGEVSANEYTGKTITKSNKNMTASITGMVIDNDIHLSVVITHNEWSPKVPQWWPNDNIEMYIDGVKYTVTYYEGIVEFSEGFTHGVTKTVSKNGKLVTTVEMFIEGTKDTYKLKLGMNGAKFTWLGALWEAADQPDITTAGLTYPEPGTLPSTLTMDGLFNEDIWTTVNNGTPLVLPTNKTAGAEVTVKGTLMDEGVLLGITVIHTKAPEVSVNGQTNYWNYMNAEFHFNSDSSTGFFSTCKNEKNASHFFAHCNTTNDGTKYTSTFEYYIPFSSIGVPNGTTSIDFTVAGWFETSWCWVYGNSWNATHTLTVNGITQK